MREIKDNIVSREFFREGDVVINKATNDVYIYLSPKGFNKKIVVDINTMQETTLENVILHFHPDFNPGMIHRSQS